MLRHLHSCPRHLLLTVLLLESAILLSVIGIVPSATCFQRQQVSFLLPPFPHRAYQRKLERYSAPGDDVNNGERIGVVAPVTTEDRAASVDDDYVLVENGADDRGRREALINAAAGGLLVASGVASYSLFSTELYTPKGYRRISPIQFMAVLGDPTAKSGKNVKDWGLWRQDPGPRGVFLKDYESVRKQNDGVTPAGWKLNPSDFWLDEHGIIMEAPSFPVQPGRYLVTGGRIATTGLLIDDDGTWRFDDDRTTLYDVTHLPCRSARYQPTTNAGPQSAKLSDFPVLPGASMPDVDGCTKQQYAVLLVVGKGV